MTFLKTLAIVSILSIFSYESCLAVSKPNDVNIAASGKVYRSPQRWAPDIAAFKKMDDQNFPPQNAVLFVGSSSIRLWDIKKFFPDLAAINRGFGGSYISESVYYADKIVLPYKPRIIVFYAGDNDIAGKKPPELLLSDFNDFATIVHKNLPKTRIIYIAIKPSIKRWLMWPQAKKANDLILQYCRSTDFAQFLDIAPAMLGADGKPRPELFVPDGLHLNETGYQLWTKMLNPMLADKTAGKH